MYKRNDIDSCIISCIEKRLNTNTFQNDVMLFPWAYNSSRSFAVLSLFMLANFVSHGTVV